MFWADKVAVELKKRKLPLEWVDDMKTPSGKIHVGALRGVVIHDLAYKALLDQKVKAKYTWIFDNHDPMDALPVYLPREFEKYLGMPLYKIPSPVKGFKNYAEYYARDFINVFTKIDCNPEVLWATDLYESGQMNKVIKECLDKSGIIRKIYEEIYKKELADDWYPFQVYCPNCGKVSTTRVTSWDGEEVEFICDVDRLKWTKGCDFKGSVSPFSSRKGITGKLSWKVEWPAKWKALGITVEGAGKDHMSAGGSHDVASLICQRVLNYPVPYVLPYEWFLVGGKKMSTSKGVGVSAADMLEIVPPEILRFLMVKTKISVAINFDPSGDTIPNLFDEYQRLAGSSDPEEKRIFELSKVGKISKIPAVRFSTLAQWVQMPNMEEKIKEEGLEDWAKYARVWLDKFAPEEEKFTIQTKLPEEAKKLSKEQKHYLKLVAERFDKCTGEVELGLKLYNWIQESMLKSNEAFVAIYIALLGKDHGPKAASLIRSLDKEFIKKRFQEASK